jgi:hypothetical protein
MDVHFADNSGILDHHGLNILFINVQQHPFQKLF